MVPSKPTAKTSAWPLTLVTVAIGLADITSRHSRCSSPRVRRRRGRLGGARGLVRLKEPVQQVEHEISKQASCAQTGDDHTGLVVARTRRVKSAGALLVRAPYVTDVSTSRAGRTTRTIPDLNSCLSMRDIRTFLSLVRLDGEAEISLPGSSGTPAKPDRFSRFQQRCNQGVTMSPRATRSAAAELLNSPASRRAAISG